MTNTPDGILLGKGVAALIWDEKAGYQFMMPKGMDFVPPQVVAMAAFLAQCHNPLFLESLQKDFQDGTLEYGRNEGKRKLDA